MKGLSDAEIEILLVLVKDFSKDYNSNNITKEVNITRQGAFKVMKHLAKKGILKSKQMGKATFYKANLEDYYVFRTIETLLITESREKAQRWLFEFRELDTLAEISVIFGSVLKDQNKAKDIDLLVVFKKNNYKAIMAMLDEKNKILTKPIHPIMQLPSDLVKNLKDKDKIVLNILRRGHVLSGYDKVLEVIKNAASKQ